MPLRNLPFYCPSCGCLSTPVMRSDGRQSTTEFYCANCDNRPDFVESKPASRGKPAKATAAHPESEKCQYCSCCSTQIPYRPKYFPHDVRLCDDCRDKEEPKTQKCARCPTQIPYAGRGLNSIDMESTHCFDCYDKWMKEVKFKNSFWGKLFG